MSLKQSMYQRYLNPWKIAGDSLIALHTAVASIATAEEISWLMYTSIFSLAIGKVLLNIGEAVSNAKKQAEEVNEK